MDICVEPCVQGESKSNRDDVCGRQGSRRLFDAFHPRTLGAHRLRNDSKRAARHRRKLPSRQFAAGRGADFKRRVECGDQSLRLGRRRFAGKTVKVTTQVVWNNRQNVVFRWGGYLYSTPPRKSSSKEANVKSLVGYGVGIPLCKVYTKFLGGYCSIRSIQNHGPRLKIKLQALL